MSEDTKEPEKENDNYYVLGLFYFNRNDKRLLPPKRRPWMGWTINFANPWSILLFIAIIATCILLDKFVFKK
ncbi:MAG: hypothetical protein EOP51_07310 [Sphingobacteriales bacterium]|nr:MAG: hypothetical protein EOP51_07310 [Sphingobacteriales bacterium]